ncbi:hypothetical protein [Pseudomonas brenneri]|uniref:hypothetical protein n=1 Tax=Pseudomonas brenneri TaxID=129817 RepID=UPI0028D5E1A3|nr:hypothetical protein [Pseudomonas brenneri]
MSHPKNSNKPPKAQALPRPDYESQLANCSQDMQEAGAFVLALGALLRGIYAHEVEQELLPASVTDGLAAGLSIIGSKLSDNGEACRDLLRRNGAFAQGGAQ